MINKSLRHIVMSELKRGSYYSPKTTLLPVSSLLKATWKRQKAAEYVRYV